MDRDRNLLFGIFAVQLKKVTPTQALGVDDADEVFTVQETPGRYQHVSGNVSERERQAG